MPRTRRPRTSRGGKARNVHSNSPSSNAALSATPPPSGGRRTAVAAPPASAKASGRTTQNSRGNRGRSRGPGPSRKNASNGRSGSSRGRGRISKKDSLALQDPSFYKDQDGVVYKRGDFAYVDSQQPELPYHICVIRDFKMARKDAVIAEIKWFYRVTELPEAVYSLLMEDRRNDSLFSNPKAKERELFMAFNVDTHPASLLRGKCKVKEFSEVKNSLPAFMDKDHAFFYRYGYKPESRRLTQLDEESFVPHSQQAMLPECLCPTLDKKPPASMALEHYKKNDPKEMLPAKLEDMVWHPKLTDEDLLMYLRAARSIALHAGVCMTGYMADGYLAASSDETTQHAFDVLHCNEHSTEKALLDLVKRPIISRLLGKKSWSKENAVLFGKGMRQFGKNFSKIQKELLPGKKIVDLVEYYYYWKKTNAGLTSRSTRRQRKMTHIRLCRSLLKPREDTPEKEFMDWDSCDEDEDQKGKNYYACRHCFSQQSSSGWHHAGPSKAILCQSCLQYFQHYGILEPISSKTASPPEFMYKEYHEVGQDDNSCSSGISHALQSPPITGRKTRNSNGSRGGTASRPGLRSGKNKSDTDEEEAEVSGESANDSSCEDDIRIPIKLHKPIQVRHSLLDKLDEASKATSDPPSKRQKREDNMSTMSEEYGSEESTNGEQEIDGSQKSPCPGGKSPGGHSSSSSTQADDEGDSPNGGGDVPRSAAEVGGARASVSACTPQQFKRVSKDTESTCARTDLVYVHQPAAEKELATSTTIISHVQLPGHGSSAHGGGGIGGHLLEPQTLPANIKVPQITPHAPRLPMGPPAMMGFPLPYPPMTPQAIGGQHIPLGPLPTAVVPTEGVIKRSNSMEAQASSHEEHLQQQQQQQQQRLALWQQHQQQQQQQQQQQLAALHLSQMPVAHHPIAVQTPSFVAIHPPPPPHSSHAPPLSEAKPQAFTFSAEEINNRRWMEQLALHGGGMVPAAAIHQNAAASAAHPQQVMELLYAQQVGGGPGGAARPLTAEEMLQVGGARIILPQELMAAGYPPEALGINMEHLIAQQQQQQQQQQMAVLASRTELQQQLMEYEPMLQQLQKDPACFQNPHFQAIMQQRELIIHQLRLHEMLIQQEMQKKQQQQQFVLGRPPAGHDDPLARTRPGVIVNQTK